MDRYNSYINYSMLDDDSCGLCGTTGHVSAKCPILYDEQYEPPEVQVDELYSYPYKSDQWSYQDLYYDFHQEHAPHPDPTPTLRLPHPSTKSRIEIMLENLIASQKKFHEELLKFREPSRRSPRSEDEGEQEAKGEEPLEQNLPEEELPAEREEEQMPHVHESTEYHNFAFNIDEDDINAILSFSLQKPSFADLEGSTDRHLVQYQKFIFDMDEKNEASVDGDKDLMHSTEDPMQYQKFTFDINEDVIDFSFFSSLTNFTFADSSRCIDIMHGKIQGEALDIPDFDPSILLLGEDKNGEEHLRNEARPFYQVDFETIEPPGIRFGEPMHGNLEPTTTIKHGQKYFPFDTG